MKSGRVVSLSVHRNTKERKRRKELRADMVSAARSMASREDLVGYYLIGIGRNGAAYSSFDTGRAIPMWAVAGFVADAIRADVQDFMAENEGQDDYER